VFDVSEPLALAAPDAAFWFLGFAMFDGLQPNTDDRSCKQCSICKVLPLNATDVPVLPCFPGSSADCDQADLQQQK
jgi:hypothetical protein